MKEQPIRTKPPDLGAIRRVVIKVGTRVISRADARQACAAVWQGLLMGLYEAGFGRSGVTCGQVLLTEGDFDDRSRHLKTRAMLGALLAHGAAPVINEDDAVTAEKLATVAGNDRPVFSENDRLAALVACKLESLREGVRSLARRPDPMDEVLRETELDEGLILRQVPSPLGVLLKGGREAGRTNRVLISCLRDALCDVQLDPNAVAGLEGREDAAAAPELHDLVETIRASTRIPVLGHSEGVCHPYVDDKADPEMAARLAVDGKSDYPAARNATEALLIHRGFLPRVRALRDALAESGVELRVDEICKSHFPGSISATEADRGREYGDEVLAVFAVDDVREAIEKIHRHGSGHTDAIVTEAQETATVFLREVDSASVFHNASTRFADGYRFGLGAEVGISTGRIHARGPVGVEGLLTTRWILRGRGQCAGDYGPGKRSFKHSPRGVS